jgi:hypothetical protein
MRFEEITLEILKVLLPKSGVREWEDAGYRAAVTLSACEMATAILSYGESEMPSDIYIDHGTTIVFGSEVGDDVAWSTENIANAAGRQATLYDLGADGTARPGKYRYRFHTQAQASPTVGNSCELYMKTSDGTHPDNDDGTSDAAVSASDKTKNLDVLKPAICDEAAANIEFVSKGIVRLPHRWCAPVLWNALGSAITNDVAETKLHLTPLYDQVQ